MVQRPHGIKGVRSVTRTSLNAGLGLQEVRIGVPQANTNSSVRRAPYQVNGAFDLGGNRKHAHLAFCGTPHFVEKVDRSVSQQAGWMHPTSRMAEKRSFQMDAKRPGTIAILGNSQRCSFCGFAKIL